MDTITTQIALNAMLDIIWPLLPPAVLSQLAYI